MKVKIHDLFAYLLETAEAMPEAALGLSLSRSPTLGEYLSDLDPAMSLDWNGRSFLGLPELRGHVLRQAGLEGICAPDDVLITAGAAEANYLALMQNVEAGDRLVVEAPGWPQAEVIGRAIGAEIVRVERREEECWALPLDRLEAAAAGARMILLTNPNNPTGRLMGRAELMEAARIAEAAGAWLLIDEVYAGLEWEGPRAPSVAGLSSRGITTGSVSKALGLQGLRIGWLICRDAGVVRDAMILRENGSEIMNVLGEAIAEVALRPGRLDAALARARAEGRANLDVLDAFVAGEEGLSWVRPQAGLIGLARLPDGVEAAPLARALLAPPNRTFVIPGDAYGQPRHLRLGVGGGPEAALGKGLARLSRALSSGAGSPG